MSTTTEMSPVYNNQKSFYKKAHIVRHDNGDTDLISYTTKVAYVKDGEMYVKGSYSATTLIHIKEFIQQMGFETGTKSHILKWYAEDRFEEVQA